MGFTPAQVGEMSLWEFKACCDGFNVAHGAKEAIMAPTDEEFWDAVHGVGNWRK